MFKPKIKAYLDIFPVEKNVYQVRGGEFLSVLRGKTIGQLFDHLLPLLNGQYTMEQIIEKLDGIASPDTIKAVIRKLLDSTILEDASKNQGNGFSAEQAGRYQNQMMFFGFASQQSNVVEYQKALQKSAVSIIGRGELVAKIASECAQIGVGSVTAFNLALEGDTEFRDLDERQLKSPEIVLEDIESIERLLAVDRPALLAIALDRPEPEILDRVNDLSQYYKIPLIHARIDGREGIIGPLVIPGKSACLKCQHLRMTRNYDFYDEYIAWERWVKGDGKHRRSAAPSLGPFTSMIAGMTALEIVKQLSGFYEPELFGKFLTVNAMNFEVLSHPVLKVPRCPSCGNAREKVSYTPWLEKRSVE